MSKLFLLAFSIKSPALTSITQHESEAGASQKAHSLAGQGYATLVVDPTDTPDRLTALVNSGALDPDNNPVSVPTAALLSVFNSITGKATKKFADRVTGVTQTLRAIQVLAGRQPTVEPTPVPPTEPTTQEDSVPNAATRNKAQRTVARKKSAAKTTAGERAPRLISYDPKAKTKIKTVREGTKLATLIDMLAEGTTLSAVEKELSKTGKAVNARSWLSWSLNSVAGYGVKSKLSANGKDLELKLTYPEGMGRPLAHTPRASDKE